MKALEEKARRKKLESIPECFSEDVYEPPERQEGESFSQYMIGILRYDIELYKGYSTFPEWPEEAMKPPEETMSWLTEQSD